MKSQGFSRSTAVPDETPSFPDHFHSLQIRAAIPDTNHSSAKKGIIRGDMRNATPATALIFIPNTKSNNAKSSPNTIINGETISLA